MSCNKTSIVISEGNGGFEVFLYSKDNFKFFLIANRTELSHCKLFVYHKWDVYQGMPGRKGYWSVVYGIRLLDHLILVLEIVAFVAKLSKENFDAQKLVIY